MKRAEDVEEAVLLRFRTALLQDQAAERVRPVAEYLERFPREHWDLILREYVGAQHEPAGDGQPGGPGSIEEGGFGHYRILRELGRGGQGTVYLAEDTRLHRQVALKVLGGGSGSPGQLIRFRREAELASKLSHPNICTVYDSGTDGGRTWISMRYVAGESLTHRIARTRSGDDEDPSDPSLVAGESIATPASSGRDQR